LTPDTPESPRLTKPDWLAMGAAVLVTILLTAFAARGPAWLCFWEDDGVYMATAKSLADGHGYRHAHLPGEPWQTKYPPLYPGALSVIWRLWPEYPANHAGVVWFNGACAAGALLLAYWLARRRLGCSTLVSAAGVLAASVSMYWWTLMATAMSEMLYTLLALAALAMAPWHEAPRAGRRALIAGAVAALAYLTRTFGLAVIVAVVLPLLLRRRWRDAMLACALPAFAVIGWSLWRGHAVGLNASIPSAQVLFYDLDYVRSGVPPDAGAMAWTVACNAAELAWSLVVCVSNVMRPLFAGWLNAGGPAALLVVGLVLLAWGLLITGALRSRKGGAAGPLVLIVSSMLLTLPWAFSPGRFLVPLTPLLCVLMVRGAGWLAAWALGDLPSGAGRAESPSPGASAACVIAALLMSASSVYQLHRLWSQPQYRQRVADALNADAELIRTGTPADAVVAVRAGGALHLLTGRKFVPVSPSDNTYYHFYPTDRRWWMMGLDQDTPGALARHKQLLETAMLASFKSAGVTAVVTRSATVGREGNLRRFMIDHNESFDQIAASADHSTVIYAVR